MFLDIVYIVVSREPLVQRENITLTAWGSLVQIQYGSYIETLVPQGIKRFLFFIIILMTAVLLTLFKISNVRSFMSKRNPTYF